MSNATVATVRSNASLFVNDQYLIDNVAVQRKGDMTYLKSKRFEMVQNGCTKDAKGNLTKQPKYGWIAPTGEVISFCKASLKMEDGTIVDGFVSAYDKRGEVDSADAYGFTFKQYQREIPDGKIKVMKKRPW